tara:strand:+ start:445 stop:1173 length:729 start_codon:yes stop_codon:yes gene_type:complete
MLKKLITWLFPGKLNFEEEFYLNPISEGAKKAFAGLNSAEFREYFNYAKPSGLFKLLDDGVHHHSYEEELNLVIDRLESTYISKGKNGIEFCFDYLGDNLLSSKGFSFGYKSIKLRRKILLNLELICEYLNRKPITELVEDIFAVNSDGLQKVDEDNRSNSKLAKNDYADHKNKVDFLERLINKLEIKKVDRLEIIKILKEKFANKFEAEVQHIVRINGIWTIKFNDRSVNIPPSTLKKNSK